MSDSNSSDMYDVENRRKREESTEKREEDKQTEETEEKSVEEQIIDDLIIDVEEEDNSSQINVDDFEWSVEIEKAKSRLQQYFSDDTEEEVNIAVSQAPYKAKNFFSTNPYARDYILDILLPLTLFIYGLILFIGGIITGSNIFTEQSRLATFFLFDGILLIFAAIVFVALRRYSSNTSEMGGRSTRKKLRRFLVIIHLLPSLLFILLAYELIVGGVVAELSQLFFEWRVYLNEQVIPRDISEIGFVVWDLIDLGLSVQQVGILMVVIGLFSSIPFLLGILKVFIISINLEPSEQIEEKDHIKIVPKSSDGRRQQPETARPRTSAEVSESEVNLDEEADIEDIISEGISKTHPDLQKSDGMFEEKYRYWVEKPYSYIVILYNTESSEYKYRAVEPDLKEDQRDLLDRIKGELIEQELRYENVVRDSESDGTDEKSREKFAEKIEEKFNDYIYELDIELSKQKYATMLYYLKRDLVYYNKIQPMIRDQNVEDIHMNGPNKAVYVNHEQHEEVNTDVEFSPDEAQRFVSKLATLAGKSINKSDPEADGTLPNGSRINMTLADEITEDGSTFTIRNFQDIPFSPVDLLKTDTFNSEMLAYLWLAIENEKSLIFAGATASGKTTTLNAVSLFIPPDSKIVTIEDTREVMLPHENWIPSVTRPSIGDADNEIGMYDLLENALRQRPKYMIVGEVRGDGAKTLFQGMSTGHTTYSTFHASTATEALNRFSNDPINVSEEILSALDIICVQNRRPHPDPDNSSLVRKNESIEEYQGTTEEGFDTQNVFSYRPADNDWNGVASESGVLDDIRKEKGWSNQDLQEELQNRMWVLERLEEEEADVRDAVSVIQAYMKNKDRVLQEMANEEPNYDLFRSIGLTSEFGKQTENLEELDGELPPGVAEVLEDG